MYTLKSARRVDSNTLTDNELMPNDDIPDYIFQTLMICNYHAREFGYRKLPPNEDKTTKESSNSNDFEDSEDDDDEGINPMDAFLGIFHGSDDPVRRYLALKLSACQLSVPFLLPDPEAPSKNVKILLSALQSITKCWKMSSGDVKHVFATEHRFPVVSFIRFSEIGMSKSSFINKIMSDGGSDHNFFFTKEMKGGHNKRKVVDGLVELCWYLPGGSEKRILKNEICFANLRGDAKNFQKQRDVLAMITSVLCLLLSSENPDETTKKILEDEAKRQATVILIFEKKPESRAVEYFKDLTTKHRGKFAIVNKARYKNDDNFFKALKENIQKNINGVKEKPLVELASHVSKYDIRLDVDLSYTQFQKNVDSWLKEGIKEAKKRLKLQLHVPALADLEREIASESGVKKIYERIEEEKDAQKASFEHLDPRILYCLKSIASMKEDERNKELNKLKHKLDKMSLQVTAEFDEVNQMENISTPQALEDKCLKLSREKYKFSFGLEHIMRELAQLYQIEESKYDYAGAAADMLLSGQPLEILDGDSFYIPLEWFNAVYTKLEQKTSDAKLFVISVLGIQSSGKSTMLNTMFGLDLPVSAGICTRGVFASLIPVSDSLKSVSKFDYVLVIDTKGLSGSADAQSLKRDNELATFSVGVADLAIVNIFGENHNQVKGFLEIAVHALLKMKLSREEKSFKIVHQNVPAVDAKTKLDLDRVKLKLDLDEMTRRAAVLEDCEEEVKGLNDIISFDENRDVFYIPALHQGNPPMAPVNPDYGMEIQTVKRSIITLMCLNQTLRVSYFRKRVSSLWEAMQKENFIFSFRNEIEIRAHKALEQKYFELSISKMVRGMNELQIKVEAALEKCSTRKEREEKWIAYQKQINHEAEKIRKEMEEETEDFFQSNEDRATLEQWRKTLKEKMEKHKEKEISELKKRCLSTYNNMQSLQDITGKKHEFEALLREKVKLFAKSFHGGQNETERKKEFEKEWKNWIKDIPECQEEKINVNNEMVKVLCNMEETQGGKMQAKLVERNNEISKFKNEDIKIGINDLSYDLVMIDEMIGKITGNTGKKQCVRSAGEVKESAVERAIEFAKSKLKSGVRCMPDDLKLMYHEVIIILDGKEKSYAYKFRDSLRCDILLYAFAQTYKIFEEMEENYIQKKDIKGQIQKDLRPMLEKYSQNVHKKKRELNAASMFVEILEKKIESAVNQKMGAEVVVIAQAKEKKFKSKRAFHASVLIELADEFAKTGEKSNGFKLYKEYLDNPVKFLSEKLEESIKTVCSREEINTSIRECLEGVLNAIQEDIFEAISIASQETIDAGKNLTYWILRFVELCPKIAMKKETFGVVAIEDLENIVEFQEKVTEEVDKVFEEWKTRSVNLQEYEPSLTSAREKMFQEMFACQEKCPFCDALCDETMDDHTIHSTDFHRPSGVAGRKHESTKKLSTAFCTRRVASYWKTFTFKSVDKKTSKVKLEKKKYKDYRSIDDVKYSSWNIPADKTYEKSKYWQWFFATFAAELANFYVSDKLGYFDIPKTWKQRKFRDAKDELQRVSAMI